MKKLDKDLQILLHIIKYCERIKKVAPIFENDFNNFIADKNFVYLDSCSFSIFQIGELVGNLSDDLKNKYKEIPWQKIKGLRNIIAHKYGTIEFDMLWGVVQNDIEELNNNCRKILETYDTNYQEKLDQELKFLQNKNSM